MAKVKKRTLRWQPSESSQVIGYKLYWSETGEIDYDCNCAPVGNVSKIVLPDDVEGFNPGDGPLVLGITAIDEVGNESDIVTLKAPYQFSVPRAPKELRFETSAAPKSRRPSVTQDELEKPVRLFKIDGPGKELWND